MTRWFRWRFNKVTGPQPWRYEETECTTAANLRAMMEDRISDEASRYGRASGDWNFIKVPPAGELDKLIDRLDRKIGSLNETLKRYRTLREHLK